MSILLLLVLAVLLSVPAVITGERRLPGREYWKTAVTLSLLAAVMVYSLQSGWSRTGLWFAAALCFAAAADYLLAHQRRDWYFAAGLVGFLLAYGIYGVLLHRTAGFNTASVVVGILAAAGIVLQYRWLSGIPPRLRVPVVVYMMVVSHLLTAGAALALWFGSIAPAMLIMIGVGSIYFSDSCIAYNEFRRKLPHDELWILPSYYLGQLCMTAVFLLYLLPAAATG